MLSAEENELLTRVGPGTPCGNLLRRYWHPIGAASELTPQHPKKRVKILGEELVAYRDGAGGYGLIAEHCAHRGVSLYYGFLEESCIRCPYHGWLYDASGRCLEQPFEPSSSFKDHIHQTAYPVEQLAGLLFAYLGPPERKPALPRWDILVWKGHRRLERLEVLSCNWLQAVENTADFVHTYFLHCRTMELKGKPHMARSYLGRPFARYGFQPRAWGLLKSWDYEGENAGSGWGNLLILPTMLRQSDIMSSMHWRVPVDDTHTQIFVVHFKPSVDGAPVVEPDEPPLEEAPPQTDADGAYLLDTFYSQDKMAWETQGAIQDRTHEHLGYSDQGIILWRKLLREQIQLVQQGGDPAGLVWDEAEDGGIPLERMTSERDLAGGAPARGPELPRVQSFEDVFDEQHRVFEVPFGAARPAPAPTAG